MSRAKYTTPESIESFRLAVEDAVRHRLGQRPANKLLALPSRQKW